MSSAKSLISMKATLGIPVLIMEVWWKDGKTLSKRHKVTTSSLFKMKAYTKRAKYNKKEAMIDN
jgi:hypothetical protein